MDHKSVVYAIYRKHDPTKLGSVDRVLKTFVGREEKLLNELRRKFHISDEEYDDIVRSTTATATATSPPSYEDSLTVAGGAGAAGSFEGELHEPMLATPTVQAEAVPYDPHTGPAYHVKAEDVQIHDPHATQYDNIPYSQTTQALGNRGVVQIRNPDGSTGYIVANQEGGQGQPGQHPLVMRGYQDNQGRMVIVHEHIGNDRNGSGCAYKCGRICFSLYVVFVAAIVISSIIGSIVGGEDNSEENDDDASDDKEGGGGGGGGRRLLRGTAQLALAELAKKI